MQTLTAWLGRAISFALYYSPAWVRRALGNFLAFLWFDLFRIRREVVLDNLHIAFPDMNKQDRTRLGRKSLQSLALNMIEFSFFRHLSKENLNKHFVFKNPELVDAKLAEGKGVLVLTCHVGHGDLACAAMSLRGWPVVIVSKVFKLRWLNELWFGMRERVGTRFIAPRDSSYALLKSLKKGAIVIIPLDQFTGPPIGVATKFFGRETGTAAGLAVMAERSGAPVLSVYTYRGPDNRHVLHFVREMPIPERNENDPARTTRVTQSFNDELEKYVRAHPEQWLWIHKRWKRFVVQ